MKVREYFQITARAIKFLAQMDPADFRILVADALVRAITPYVGIYFSAKLVDALFDGKPVNTLFLYAALTVGLTFVFSVFTRWLLAARNVSRGRRWHTEQWYYSKKAMEMAYESIENHEIHALREKIHFESQTAFNMDCLYDNLSKAIFHSVQIAASTSMTLSLFLLPAVSIPVKLGLSFGILLTLVLCIFSSSKKAAIDSEFYGGTAAEYNLTSSKYNEYLSDYETGKDIRLYDMTDLLITKDAGRSNAFFQLFRNASLKKALTELPKSSLTSVLKFAAYMVLLLAAAEGSVSIGSIAKYISCLMLFLGAGTGLASAITVSVENSHHLKIYFSYFDIPNHMYQGSLTVEKRDDNEYYIEFRDVSFRYPNTEDYALRHINLKFKVGEKLAVVGRNGSGKSTFIKLMCRLYDPTEGEILLNGVNIKKYDYDEYMSIFSIVFQDFRLLAFTLGENVAAGSSYDEGRVRGCLSKAGFGNRLAALPEGCGTFLYQNYSKDGIEISGGEAQKVALARALYKDAPFIILDEPTAAFDPVSEYEIYSKFNQIVGDKTAIYISHRLASCRFCDKIAVFDCGRIVQTGSHEQLLAKDGGIYQTLWNAQAQYYTG